MNYEMKKPKHWSQYPNWRERKAASRKKRIEYRSLTAYLESIKGKSRKEIAALMGNSVSTVSRYLRMREVDINK